MNINIESLIYKTQDCMYDMSNYEIQAKKHFPCGDALWHERNYNKAWAFIRDVSEILCINSDNLYLMARAVRKWEEKHNWERFFPFENHERAIMEYLTGKRCSNCFNKGCSYLCWDCSHNNNKDHWRGK
jgi:hypothetical protein